MSDVDSSASLPLLLDARTLERNLDRPDLLVVAVDALADFESIHIPGAVQLDFGSIIRNEGAVKGLLPPPEVLSQRLAAIGLQAGRHVVAYDRSGGAQASRLLFTLDVLGHDNFSLLDGGLSAWLTAGLPTETGQAKPKASAFQAMSLAERIADRAYICHRLDEPNLKLLDTRSQPEFAGVDVRAARGGHIPGAAHLDWVELKEADDTCLPREQILAKLAERGITPEDEVVVYCHSHTRSSHTYIALKAAGFERVRGYPGAWSDWGNHADTPANTL